jgi:rsbT antagonist protein RsbS
MEDEISLSRVAMHISRGCLIVPIQIELYDEIILQIQKDILERVKETGVKGVIIDVSGVEIIDSFLAQAICDTVRMASMLGAATVLTGLKPEIAASLVELDIEFKDVWTAMNLEAGFQRLEPFIRPKEEPEEIEKDEKIEELERETDETQEVQNDEYEEIEEEDNYEDKE